MRISKSKFVAGVQCLKRLYWKVHQPELASEPGASGQAMMDQGQEVGRLAHQLFPGGVKVDGSGGLSDAISITKDLVENSEVPAIFEGTFSADDVLVRVDILKRQRDKRWRLIEVKSSTDLKDHYLPDIGIQSRIVSRSGLDLASAWLAHINRKYVLTGEAVDPRQFFRIRSVTGQVKRLQPKLSSQLRSEFSILAMSKAPEIAAGKHCTDPVTCEFYDRCNPPLPDDHIRYLPRIQPKKIDELLGMGIESIHEIPNDFPLNERLRLAATCVQKGKPWFSEERLVYAIHHPHSLKESEIE